MSKAICRDWLESCTVPELDITDITRFGDRERQGIDEYGNRYTRRNGLWWYRKKTDYEIALDGLNEEFPGIGKSLDL